MYQIKDILTLSDNNKYVVTNKTLYNDKYYYMLVDFNDDDIFLIMYEENNTLIVEDNPSVITKVLFKF